MKIAFVSAVWGRVPLTRIWWKGATRICQQLQDEGFEAQVCVAGSESAHRALCLEHKGAWIEADNKKLGAKWNSVVRYALNVYGADYIFILGSDDFFGSGLIAQYAGLIRQDVPYAGIATMYMYEPWSDRLLMLDPARKAGMEPGVRGHGKCDIRYIRPRTAAHRATFIEASKRQTLGAGRLIHRSLLPMDDIFWEPDRTSSLDASMTKTCNLPGPFEMRVSPDFIAVDVKNGLNIWSFDALLEWYPGGLLPSSDFLSSLPEWEEIRQFACSSTLPG